MNSRSRLLLVALLVGACGRVVLVPVPDGSSDDAGTRDAGNAGSRCDAADCPDAGPGDNDRCDAGSGEEEECETDPCGSGSCGPATGDAGSPDAGLDAGGLDAGAIDAGSIDAGSIDAGSIDAGSTDAGSTDAGSSDAGSSDAGTLDAGSLDAGSADDDGGDGDPGNDGGVDCAGLRRQIQAALDAASACNPDDPAACTITVQGLCCPEPVGDPASAATLRYLELLRAFHDARCFVACSDVICYANPGRCASTSLRCDQL